MPRSSALFNLMTFACLALLVGVVLLASPPAYLDPLQISLWLVGALALEVYSVELPYFGRFRTTTAWTVGCLGALSGSSDLAFLALGFGCVADPADAGASAGQAGADRMAPRLALAAGQRNFEASSPGRLGRSHALALLGPGLRDRIAGFVSSGCSDEGSSRPADRLQDPPAKAVDWRFATAQQSCGRVERHKPRHRQFPADRSQEFRRASLELTPFEAG